MYKELPSNERKPTLHLPSSHRRLPGTRTSGKALQASSQNQETLHLICALRAATGNALMTVLAGFAFTLISLPKAILVPALVAGFWRVLIMQSPGMTNFPAFFTSDVAKAAKLPMIPLICFGFSSFSVARVLAIALLVMAFAPAFFIAFMGAMIARAGAFKAGGSDVASSA